jgi:hypothetical protein
MTEGKGEAFSASYACDCAAEAVKVRIRWCVRGGGGV